MKIVMKIFALCALRFAISPLCAFRATLTPVRELLENFFMENYFTH